MASLLRQIVAGPRARHPEAGIDLCYVTDNIVATSGPGATYPQVYYRTPVKDLVKWLDKKHGDKWAIWEFRAEGTGYPDSEVYGRVWHYPWPDHHPPPFALMPLIMASMRNWLKDKEVQGRVVVVHCKAGKGRSGTVSCSYLISEEGWSTEDAMKRFTERRMKPGFGVGISIPSQKRWISYVERWTKHGKKYIERPVEILEVHVWGLRDGVKIAVEGYVEEGKVIKKFHQFHSSEREIVRGTISRETGFADVAREAMGRKKTNNSVISGEDTGPDDMMNGRSSTQDDTALPGGDVIFKPSSRVVLPSSDVNIDFERRNKTTLGGFTMVTSVAHVWFNIFFEGRGPENDGKPDNSGVFEIDWDAMDGIKGSSRKGTRAFDKLAVVWKAVALDRKSSVVINEPADGEEVKQTEPADWRGEDGSANQLKKQLGLRPEDVDSTSISRASSLRSEQPNDTNDSMEELHGVKSHINGDDDLSGDEPTSTTSTQLSELAHADSASAEAARPHAQSQPLPETQVDGASGLAESMKHVSTTDLPDGVPASELEESHEHTPGHMIKAERE